MDNPKALLTDDLGSIYVIVGFRTCVKLLYLLTKSDDNFIV